MAVQFQAAAKILPLKAERPPAPKRETPQSDFKEHFDGARFAAGAERRRPTDKPGPSDDIKPKEPVDEKPEADESAEADAEQVVVAVAQPVTQNLVILPSGDDVAPAQFETKNPTRVDDQIRRARGPAETTNVGNRLDKPIHQPGGAKSQPVPVTNTPPVVDGEVASSAVSVASESETKARPEFLTPTRTTSAASHDDLTAAPVDRSTGAELRATEQSGSRSSATQPVESRESASSKPEIVPVDVRAEGGATGDEGDATDQRSLLSARAKDDAKTVETKDLKPRFDNRLLEAGDDHGAQKDRPTPGRVKPDDVDHSQAIKKIDIRSGRGDSGASSLGRFLISAAKEGSVSTANVSPGNSSTPTSSPAGLQGGTAHSFALVRDAAPRALTEILSPPVSAADALDAAAKVFSASNNGGRQQVTLQLDPPELGQLRLQIRMHHDAMTLRVDANSQVVAKLIESRLPELRDALASHGIRVERSEVIVARSASFDNQSQSQSDQQSSSSNQQPGHGQFNESRSSWAEGHRFGAPGHDGSSGREERSHSAGSDETDANVVSASRIDGNESTLIAEYWLDLVA